MRRRWYLLAFAGLLVLALMATLPLRLAGLDNAGVTASAVTGTIWSGRLTDAALRGLPLGDVETGLAPLPLLGGTLRMGVVSAGLQGAITRGPDDFGVAALTGQIGPLEIGGLPVNSIDFAGVDIDMRDGACIAAAGQVRVAIGLASEDALIGTARCDGDAVALPLATASGKTRLDIRIDGARGYKAVLAIDGASEGERMALLAAGFQPTPNGLARTMEGVF